MAKYTYDPNSISNPTQWAVDLLEQLDDPVNRTNVGNLVGWYESEGGNWHNTAKYNPLDTTQQMPGSSVMAGGNTAGVQQYVDWQQGLDATVKTLDNGAYQSILDDLSQSAPFSKFASDVDRSPWGSGLYGPSSPDTNVPSWIPETGSLGPGTFSGDPTVTGSTKGGSTGSTQPEDKPGSSPKGQMTGFAGVLQQMDHLYNPGMPSFTETIFSFGTSNIEDVAILIFTRATSAILFTGVIAVGVLTMLHGENAGGALGGTTNVLEFVNNTQTQNRRLGLQEERIKARSEHEERVASRFSQTQEEKERARSQREHEMQFRAATTRARQTQKETAHEKRSRRYAKAQKRHAANRKREHDLRESGLFFRRSSNKE